MIASLSGLELMLLFVWFIVGILVGIAFDILWWKTGMNKYERSVEFFEHYHWGMVLLILMKILLAVSDVFSSFAGTSIVLILVEATQEHPFALKSNHQLSSTAIGAFLFVLVVFI